MKLHIFFNGGRALGIIEGHSVSIPISNPEILTFDHIYLNNVPSEWPGTFEIKEYSDENRRHFKEIELILPILRR